MCYHPVISQRWHWKIHRLYRIFPIKVGHFEWACGGVASPRRKLGWSTCSSTFREGLMRGKQGQSWACQDGFYQQNHPKKKVRTNNIRISTRKEWVTNQKDLDLKQPTIVNLRNKHRNHYQMSGDNGDDEHQKWIYPSKTYDMCSSHPSSSKTTPHVAPLKTPNYPRLIAAPYPESGLHSQIQHIPFPTYLKAVKDPLGFLKKIEAEFPSIQ